MEVLRASRKKTTAARIGYSAANKFVLAAAIIGLLGGCSTLSTHDPVTAKKALAKPCYPTYGYIDKQGHCIIATHFASARKFSGGLGPVRVLRDNTPYNPGSGKWGFINHQGKIVIDPQFLEVLDFSEERCAVRCAETPETDRSAHDYARETYSQEEYSRNYHASGRFDHALNHFAGIGKWGFIDTSGNFTIKPQYDYAGSFVNGLAPVSLHGKWGYIDKANRLVIPLQFRRAFCFSHGLAVVSKSIDRDFQYIDASGKIAVPGKYRFAEQFFDGLAVVLVPNESRLIDRKGKVQFSNHYGWHHNRSAEGLFPSRIDNTPGMFRLQFDPKSRCFTIFAKGAHIFYEVEGDPSKTRTNKFGYIDTAGKIVVPYDAGDVLYGENYSDGLAGVCVRHGKDLAKVFLDKHGQTKFRTPFANAEPFSEGLSVVHTNYDPPNPRPYDPIR